MAILVTGGAGYIGSHTCVELLNAGYDVAVIDNFSNSSRTSLSRVAEICKRTFAVHEVNLLDAAAVAQVFATTPVDAVIHFAGLKSVAESIAAPLRYYQQNVSGTVVLCEVMRTFGVHRIVFSSSATVYGSQGTMPLTEDTPISPINPYGRTKWAVEQLLGDISVADPHWTSVLLRYFNPVGAHPSGRIGEDPQGIPSNLFPYLTQVAVGNLAELTVYGNDYPTADGTCERDYVHVIDIARGHVHALQYAMSHTGVETFNLGTGRGYSVLQVIAAFREATGVSVPHRVGPRRSGDAPVSYASITKAQQHLGWGATKSLVDMCANAWHWQQQNPHGYRGT